MNCLALESSLELTQTIDVTEIEARIRGQLHGRVEGLRLFRTEQGLILRGRTRTFYAKQLAQHAVMAVTDLPIVANQIVVS
jgi:hypothetical protein